MAALVMTMAALASCSSNAKATDTTAAADNVDTAAMAPDHGPMDGPHGGPEDGPHGAPNDNDMIQHRVEEMEQELNLTDEQKQKVIDLMTSHMAAKDSAREQGQRPDPEQMKKAHEEEDAKMKEILTDEQYTKYQEMQKQHKHHGPHGPKPGEGPAPK